MFFSKNNAEKLIFLHIGKTGGSTLRSIIYKNYPRGDIRHFDGTEEEVTDFLKLPEEKRCRYECLEGHMGFGLRSWFHKSSKYLVFLRHPVDRVISLYYFILNNPDHYLHSRVKPLTLREFSASNITHMVRNCQTRTLIGEEGRQIKLDEKTELDSDDLERAKSRLENDISLIGLTKAFDRSLMLCKEVLGWRNLYYARRNTGRRPEREEIEERAIESIREHNQLDLKLYEYAEVLFEERIKNYPKDIDEEVKKFRRFNRAFGPLLKARRLPIASAKKILETTGTKEFIKRYLDR